MTSHSSNLIFGAAMALASTLVVSLTAAAIKYTADYVSVEQIVLVQYLVCTALLLPWLFRRGISQLKTAHPGLLFVRGAAGWLCFYTYYLALHAIPMVDAVLLRNSAPLVVPVIVLIWFKYRMPLLNWIPVLIGFIGIALVLKPEGESFSFSFWYLIAFCSAITLALSVVTTRVLTKTEPTKRILFYYFSLSALFSVPLAISNWQPIPLSILPLMIAIGVSLWLALWLYTQAFRYSKATVISPLIYFGVLFTGLLGWLFWQQVPDMMAVIGAALIISGGIASVWLGKNN